MLEEKLNGMFFMQKNMHKEVWFQENLSSLNEKKKKKMEDSQVSKHTVGMRKLLSALYVQFILILLNTGPEM